MVGVRADAEVDTAKARATDSASSRPGDECEDGRGDPVDPLRVVHDTDQRLDSGGFGEQAQHGQSGQQTAG
ncbi:hypothetical protein [Streptomyces sp. LS1784]|uniref:hypothetical protein n=1 Tax=Streptomyces sp. LS1784 TaxID=2851533 RepID=UPI0021E12691|nr:hypothetical protein [Streptomyces sp. LS1784]